MPIPKPNSGEAEKDYIGRCISAIKDEYDIEGQAYAVCKSTFDKKDEMNIEPNPCWEGYEPIGLKPDGSPNCVPKKEEMGAIPIEIVGDNEEKILEYLPDVKSHEMEHDYLPRCVPVLYPEYVDQQKATSLCADKYQRIITVSDKRRTNMKIMKPQENKFEKNRVSFLAAITEAELKSEGILLAEQPKSGPGSFPWSECQKKMMEQYGDKDIADKVCGMIKSKYGG